MELFRIKMETERLILRRWKRPDFYDYALFAADPEVMLAAGSKPMAGPDDHEAFGEALRDADCFAIVFKETKRAIGSIKFQKDIRRYKVNSTSIGYELGKQYWGNGYMPEALRAMIRHAFEHRKVDVISIGHFTVNEKSRRVIEKCGFRHEGTLRRAFRRFDGEMFDDECYSLLKEEYFADPSLFR